jgi:anti-sigma factor RsiW
MTPTQLHELMHAVLDGEAAPDERRELETRLAADASTRAEFESLKALFEGLRKVPQGFPPEGLVASVMDGLPSGDERRADPDQLFAPSGVFEPNLKKARGRGFARDKKAGRAFQPWTFLWGEKMSEDKRGISKQGRIMIGGGIAAAAIVAVAVSTSLYPPSSTETAGTIVPAQRYRAAQPTDLQGSSASSASGSNQAAPSGQPAQGSAGTQGTLGTAGTQGTLGTAGTRGTLGTAGTQGTLGTAGTQGTLGTQGTHGTQAVVQ